MLKILSSQGPRQSADFLNENLSDIQSQKTTWLISDLKSKLEIQKLLLSQTDFLNAESVLRASELWRLLLFRVNPEWQIVSREFAISLISQYLKDLHTDELQLPSLETKFFQAENQGFANTIYNYITQLMPALSHPQGVELLTEWLAENEDCQTRWGRWFELSSQVWDIFLKEKFVAAPWTSGVVVNELDIDRLWSRNLIVDLGSELSQVESEVLVMLSKFIDVTVIEPTPSWSKLYSSSLTAYKRLREAVSNKVTPLSSGEFGQVPKITYKKFTTELAEIKDISAQIRKRLDGGVPAHDIAVIAPDVEAYLPALLSYFKIEGIGVNRDVLANFNEFREINQWVAQLRLRLGLFNESDLEISIFNQNDRSQMKYDQFAKLFRFVYSRDDLKRDQEIEKLFKIDLDLRTQVSRDKFFVWTLKFLPESIALDKLDVLFKKIWAEIPVEKNLSVDLWLNYLQALIAKTNYKISEADENGIQILNLSSCEHTCARALFVVGLCEEAFRSGFQTALTAFDVQKIAQDFGFQIFSPDQKRSEFQARWILGDPSREVYLSFAVTDFSGQILAPSWLWLEGAQKSEHGLKVELPEITRWDEIQTKSIPEILKMRNIADAVHQGIIDTMNFGPKKIDLKNAVYLSASSIESYLKCPFIYEATRLLKLTDQPSLDLDIDHMTKGSLIHKIFEKLTRAQPMKFDLSDEEIDGVIDEAKSENQMILGDERLWLSQKKKYVKIARKFLEFEETWRAKFPLTKTLGQEVAVRASVDPESLEFKKLKDETAKIIFRGSIDRVDTDGKGNAVVIDYKSSAASLSQYTSWLRNDKIQLILYALAIENAWTDIDPQKVVSAVYFVVQDLNRDTGFKVLNQEGLYSVDDLKKNKIEMKERDDLLKSGYEQVQKTISNILSGQFHPEPKRVEDCPDCKWRELCRAKHLSQ